MFEVNHKFPAAVALVAAFVLGASTSSYAGSGNVSIEGLETVQYVRNVHRYYIVFKDMTDGIAARRLHVESAKAK